MEKAADSLGYRLGSSHPAADLLGFNTEQRGDGNDRFVFRRSPCHRAFGRMLVRCNDRSSPAGKNFEDGCILHVGNRRWRNRGGRRE